MDALLQLTNIFELRELARHKAEHDRLVGGKVGERFERARAVGAAWGLGS